MPTYRAYLEGDYAAWAKSSQKAYGQNLKRLATAFKALLDKPLDKITGLEVERWRASQVERGLSNQTINRDISSIKASFNRAVDWGLLAREQIIHAAGGGLREEDGEFLLAPQGESCASKVFDGRLAFAFQSTPSAISNSRALCGFCLSPAESQSARPDALAEHLREFLRGVQHRP